MQGKTKQIFHSLHAIFSEAGRVNHRHESSTVEQATKVPNSYNFKNDKNVSVVITYEYINQVSKHLANFC